MLAVLIVGNGIDIQPSHEYNASIQRDCNPVHFVRYDFLVSHAGISSKIFHVKHTLQSVVAWWLRTSISQSSASR